MTLIAGQETVDGIQLLADGLSCDDELASVPEHEIGDERVKAFVPGRTTLKKLFPHPTLPLAIAQLGSNHRKGKQIGRFIEDFLQRTSSENTNSVLKDFQTEFGETSGSETLWLVGYDSLDAPLYLSVGNGFQRLDARRFWGGDGRGGDGYDGLSPDWENLDALQNAGNTFIERWRQLPPYNLPFFPNNFGGQWHRLDIKPGQVPQSPHEPAVHGVLVSGLLPGPFDHSLDCRNPADYILQRCEVLKVQLKGKFGMRVKGSLNEIHDPTNRERTARLVAIFNEVKLNRSVATLEDAQRYASAADEIAVVLKLT